MGWESLGAVRFDLGSLLQCQMKIAKPKSAYITCLLLVLEVCNVNQLIGNHGLGIFLYGQI